MHRWITRVAFAALLGGCAEPASAPLSPEGAPGASATSAADGGAAAEVVWRFMDWYPAGGDALGYQYIPSRLHGDDRQADGGANPDADPLLGVLESPYLRSSAYALGRCGVTGTMDEAADRATLDPNGSARLDPCAQPVPRTLYLHQDDQRHAIAPTVVVTQLFGMTQERDASGCTRCVWLYDTGLNRCERIHFESASTVLWSRDPETGARTWRVETWGEYLARCYEKQVNRQKQVSYVPTETVFPVPFLAYLEEHRVP